MRARFLAGLVLCLLFVPIPARSSPEYADSMHQAAAHLARIQLPSGLFEFEIDARTGAPPETRGQVPGMVLVRQSFAAFALSEYAVLYPGESAVRAVQSFLAKADALSIPIGKSRFQSTLESTGLFNRYRLWSVLRGPLDRFGLLYSERGKGLVLAPDQSYEKIYAGATALALAAGLNYQSVSGDLQFEDQLKGWARGLAALHVPDRGFREAPNQLTESDYLNGEGWLALAMHVDQYPHDKEISKLLPALDRYILDRYFQSASKRFFHWGGMATARRAAMSNDRRFDTLLESLVARFYESSATALDRTSNSCYLVEALATFVNRSERIKLNNKLVATADEWTDRLLQADLRLQVGDEPVTMARGGFRPSGEEETVRVDYTAHCLNALVIRVR